MGTSSFWLGALTSISVCLATLPAAGAWPTHRGNPQRTGNVDGQSGPTTPKVLWVYRAQEHFVASPVPSGDRLIVSGLGAFNVSTLHCLAVDPKATERKVWSKSTPYLKRPTVCSPAVADGETIFGDGMHQTDGAFLHCLQLDKGLPLWQLRTPQPDRLVHLEGSPTVVGKHVFIGGGALGVICVDTAKVSLEGKEMSVQDAKKILDDKWQALVKAFEEDKKKDPDFAVPPNEDMLPRPAPRIAWTQGTGKWHVDAPVNVIGGRVLVASAFLDKEQEGDRALYCLETKTGKVIWKARLAVNPWGGASVSGNTVIVTGSSIGYDTKSVKGARGQIAAFDLSAGKELWQRDLPAGVVSCAALKDDLAICTATDGKVRVFVLKTGEPRVIFTGPVPFFAPPAIAGDMVYAADLAGVVHAIDIKNGTEKWKLDLGSDPAVKAPGMVYGGPVVHGGRVFVATCNLEGAHVNKPTVVVCIGDK